MGTDLNELEKCIEVHTHKMLNRAQGHRRRVAATQVAVHTSQWLKIIEDYRHPMWSEMLDLLCIALKILNDKDGDSPTEHTDPNQPDHPSGEMQSEWAEMLRESLMDVLIYLDDGMLIKVRRSEPRKEKNAEQDPRS